MNDAPILKISPKAARVNAGISQGEAAKAMDVDVSTLRRYENGVTAPPWDIVEKMENLYCVSRDNLFLRLKIALSNFLTAHKKAPPEGGAGS